MSCLKPSTSLSCHKFIFDFIFRSDTTVTFEFTVDETIKGIFFWIHEGMSWLNFLKSSQMSEDICHNRVSSTEPHCLTNCCKFIFKVSFWQLDTCFIYYFWERFLRQLSTSTKAILYRGRVFKPWENLCLKYSLLSTPRKKDSFWEIKEDLNSFVSFVLKFTWSPPTRAGRMNRKNLQPDD